MLSISRSHYSSAGSMLVWRRNKTKNILHLDCIRSGSNVPLYEVLFSGETVFTLSPSYLEMRDGDNILRVCMCGENGTVLSGKGNLMLHSPERGNVYNASYIVNTGGYLKVCECAAGGFNYFRAVKGSVIPNAEKKLGEVRYECIDIDVIPNESGEYELILEHTESDVPRLAQVSFDECTSALAAEFDGWVKLLGCKTEYDIEHAYVLWSNTVGKTQIIPTAVSL